MTTSSLGTALVREVALQYNVILENVSQETLHEYLKSGTLRCEQTWFGTTDCKSEKTNKPGTTDLSETLPQNVGITFQSMASGKLSALRALGVG